MAGPPVIVINSDGSNNQQPSPGNRPPRRRRSRADKRAESEKDKKKKEVEQKKQLTWRVFCAIGVFVIGPLGLLSIVGLQGMAIGFIKLLEGVLYIMKLMAGSVGN